MLRYSGEKFQMVDRKWIVHEVLQVTKGKAKKAYEEGKHIWIHPCNMRVSNVWQSPMPFNKKAIEDNAFLMNSTFEDIVNDFRYYNCDNERGKYPIFFVAAA